MNILDGCNFFSQFQNPGMTKTETYLQKLKIKNLDSLIEGEGNFNFCSAL